MNNLSIQNKDIQGPYLFRMDSNDFITLALISRNCPTYFSLLPSVPINCLAYFIFFHRISALVQSIATFYHRLQSVVQSMSSVSASTLIGFCVLVYWKKQQTQASSLFSNALRGLELAGYTLGMVWGSYYLRVLCVHVFSIIRFSRKWWFKMTNLSRKVQLYSHGEVSNVLQLCNNFTSCLKPLSTLFQPLALSFMQLFDPQVLSMSALVMSNITSPTAVPHLPLLPSAKW